MQKQLMLPSAHSAVLFAKQSRFEQLKPALFVLGILVVLLGGLDLARRAPGANLSDQALKTAFAPAILIGR